MLDAGSRFLRQDIGQDVERGGGGNDLVAQRSPRASGESLLLQSMVVIGIGEANVRSLGKRVSGSRSPTDLDRIIGMNLRRLRTEKGMTLQDLAEQLNISHQQLQKYETGANRLSAGLVPVIGQVLNVSIDELFLMDNPVGPRKGDSVARLREDCELLIRRVQSEAVLRTIYRVLKALSS